MPSASRPTAAAPQTAHPQPSRVEPPAPLWRRLIASIYDGLLLLGLLMAAALIEVLVRDQLLGLVRDDTWLQLYFFLVGLAFFSLSWTRGGQTLGMRVWRLQVRRADGAALRLPIAMLRYAVMLLTWSMALAPLGLMLPVQHTAPGLLLGAGLLAALAAVPMLMNGRRRAPCDWVAGTEVVELPKA